MHINYFCSFCVVLLFFFIIIFLYYLFFFFYYPFKTNENFCRHVGYLYCCSFSSSSLDVEQRASVVFTLTCSIKIVMLLYSCFDMMNNDGINHL